MKDFKIGREQNNDLVVDDNSVSGQHAYIKISKDFKTFTLHDDDSTNGTKVNGQSILTKKINKDSSIALGSYNLDTTNLFQELNKYVLKNRTDFTKEFFALIAIEENYKKKKYNVNKYYKLKSVLLKAGITLGLLVAISVSGIFDEKPNAKIYVMIGVGTIGGIISTASLSEKNVKHKLDDLYIEYSAQFLCPKCNYDMTSKSWKYWKHKKKCPKCKCKWSN